MNKHLFWDKEPINNIKNSNNNNYEILNKEKKKIIHMSYELPENFSWYNFDINNDINDIYKFLDKNYIKNDNLIFNYSREFLKWILSNPNCNKELFVGVKFNDKIVGSIIGIPTKIKCCDKSIDIITINFLCVHRKLRNKYLAPLLIKEITRRTNLLNIWQAVFTDDINIGTPYSSSQIYHKIVNLKKALFVDFISLDKSLTYEKLDIKIKNKFKINNNLKNYFKILEKEDLLETYDFYNKNIKNKKIYFNYSFEEFCHMFNPINNIIYTFILKKNNKITDMFSFYLLNYKIDNTNEFLKNVYYSLIINNSLSGVDIINDSLFFINKLNIDIINIYENQYNILNEKDLENLNFIIGTGKCNFYIYNWSIKDILPRDNSIFLV